MSLESEFKQIGHSGGKVIFNLVTGPDGSRSYQVTYRGASSGAEWEVPNGLPLGASSAPVRALAGFFAEFILSAAEGLRMT